MTTVELVPSFSEPLNCTKYGNKGEASWENGHMFKTSERFYLRVRLPLNVEPDVVCLTCGVIQKKCRHLGLDEPIN
jgi:hypothetical protein